ncbi:MAG TPA: hypothetical protein VLH12_04765 [Usitatibacter sp.]|nr:hypothetical protein [Usitatibacter sp.]
MSRPIHNAAIAAAVAAVLGGCALFQPEKTGQTEGREYTLTVKNTLAKERFAPILVVGDADDAKIWVGKYVSPEAHTQFTTGNPGPLAMKLGGDQGQPGGLGVGGEVTFKFRTTASKARITAMVHPDVTPDNYVTALVDLKAGGTTMLERFDIGDDEKRFTVVKVGPAGSVMIR